METIDFSKTPLAVAISGPAGAGKSTVSTEAAKVACSDTVFNTGRVYRSGVRIMQGFGIYPDNEQAVENFARSIRGVIQEGFGDEQLTTFKFKDGSVRTMHPIRDKLHIPEMAPILPAYTSQLPFRRALAEVEVSTALTVLKNGWPIGGSKVFVSEGRDVFDVLTRGGIPEKDILSVFLDVSDETAARRRQHEPQFKGMNLRQIEKEISERNRADTERAHGSYGFQEERDVLIETDNANAQQVAAEIIKLIEKRVA
jgi:cytidylate kinase